MAIDIMSSGARTTWALVFHWALHAPEAVAIAAPARSPLSFGDLQRHIITLAAALNAKGLGRSSRVAMVLPNGPEMATAFLAVASCATCVPLNPEYSAEQFEFFLDHVQARALLVMAGSDSPAHAIARRRGIQLIEITSNQNTPAGIFGVTATGGPLAQTAPNLACADDVALVLYTSGTTARPKQVPLTHANLCASARNIVTALQLSSTDRCLNILPLFHIHGLVAAVLASLAAGGSVACTQGLAGGRFFEWLDTLRPTWYTAVPTMHQAILDAAHACHEVIRHNPLRFIRSSSAALSQGLAAELERCFDAPVIEAYGMTEAAHQIASNPLPPGTRKSKSVGMAAGPDVAIMDDAGHLLPSGTTGEIVIRGDNVTDGNASDSDASAVVRAAGWLRTGDQGFIDAVGYVYLTGRLKEVINRGGDKVSPREVDDALLEHPAVLQAVTFRVCHATLGEDIAAAAVLRNGVIATADEIRAFLFGRLTAFKIPTQVIIVDKIPTSATGKFERMHLEAELAERLKPTFAAPRDDAEAQVVAIFSEVLGRADVGVHDNFFALGGDSLRGFQALARIRQRLRADVSIMELFKGPTVAHIAREVERMQKAARALALESILGDVERMSDDEAPRLAQVDESDR